MKIFLYLLVGLLCLVVVTTANYYSSNCKLCSCADYPELICACNDSSCRTFSSRCQFERAICLARESCQSPWAERCDYQCDCNLRCNKEHKPVCANDAYGKTRVFDSECALDAISEETGEIWSVIDFSYCIEPCYEYCTTDYEPLCATNGKEYITFSNYCSLNQENCADEYDWGIFMYGNCPRCNSFEG